jgi:hypothetical protein
MPLLDQFGVAQTGADSVAVERFDRALWNLLLFDRDPLTDADAALERDPAFAMPHILKGSLYALSTERRLLPAARTALDAARALVPQLGEREISHIAALEAWTDGRFHDATGHWERILVAEPRDALAMFAAHQSDFLLGRSDELRDRVARRLARIDAGTALEGIYQGMHAFGLEESGDYARAEWAGQLAVAREPRDAWAIHAVAHVMEMTGRCDAGLQWLESRAADWAENCSLAVHTWWHYALFHFEERRWDEVIRIYDQRIAQAVDSNSLMQLLDASALLWRLELQSVDVGARWLPLAEVWEAHIDEGWYAFNDLHAMMALAAADRAEPSRQLLARLRACAAAENDNGLVARAVGLPAAEALLAYARGQYALAADKLAPIIAIAARAGGSHAQRDLLVLTLASAAERSGQRGLARKILAARLQLKPQTALNLEWSRRFQ